MSDSDIIRKIDDCLENLKVCVLKCLSPVGQDTKLFESRSSLISDKYSKNGFGFIPNYNEFLNLYIVDTLRIILSNTSFPFPDSFLDWFVFGSRQREYPQWNESYKDYDFMFPSYFVFRNEIIQFVNIDFENYFSVYHLPDKKDFIDHLSFSLNQTIKKRSDKGTIVNLRKKTDDVAEDVLLMNKKIEKWRLVFLEDFLSDIFSDEVKEHFLQTINDFESFINYLQTSEGTEKIYHYHFSEICSWLTFSIQSIFRNPLGFKTKQKKLNEIDLLYGRETYYNSLTKYIWQIPISYKCRHFKWLVSLISSESLFIKIGFLPGMDNTLVISGYLKSLELLLSNLIIDNAIEEGYLSYVFIDGERIFINKDNIDKVSHIMLGEIIKYIRNSRNFIKSEEKRMELCKLLKKWKDTTRNGYFHKDTLLDLEKVEKARKDTFRISLQIINEFINRPHIHYDDGEKERIASKTVKNDFDDYDLLPDDLPF